MAHNLWHLGYPDRALQRMEDALALARELSHPFSMALTLDYAAMLHQFRREKAKAQEWAEAAIELCTERGYAYYLAWGTIIQGWTLVEQRADAEKIAQMRQGLDALRATGAELRLPYYLITLAEASGKAGRIDEGLAYLNEAQEAAHKNGETWREAERFRLHGEFLLAKSANSRVEAEACFQQALDVARRQQAKSLELRAAMSLSRLWRQQDKTSEAHTLLSESYSWFTEGFETPDLVDARALLDESS